MRDIFFLKDTVSVPSRFGLPSHSTGSNQYLLDDSLMIKSLIKYKSLINSTTCRCSFGDFLEEINSYGPVPFTVP